MKKNIDLVIDGIAPEKVMYDTDNHSLVVLYPAQEEFKKGDILASDYALLIFDKYEMFKQEKDLFHSIWNNRGVGFNKNWTSKYFIHATDEQKAQVHELLKKDGKKWNAETLQVEDIKKEFKRGDIVIHDNTKRISIFDSCKNKYSGFNAIFSIDSCKNKYSRFNAIFSIDRAGNIGYNRSWNTDTLRYATSSEIEKFDNDLKEIGKKWNRETLEVEDLDISDIVVDLVSACEYLGIKRPSFFILDACKRSEKFEAQITLQLIREAWNKHDGFEVDYANSEQDKYFPVLDVYGDIKCLVSWGTTHISASCLSFPTQERAIQFGTQFKELLKTAMGI